MKRFVEVIQVDGKKIFIDNEMIESFECYEYTVDNYQGVLNMISGKTIFLKKQNNYDDAFKEIEYVIYYWDNHD